MFLRLSRPFTQLRIHFLRVWGPHDITTTSSSRPLIFTNLGKYRQNWRFLDPLPPSFFGESAVSKIFIWSSIQNAKNVQELSFGSSKTLLVSLNTFVESKNVFNFKVKILIFAQLPSLTAIKDKKVAAWVSFFLGNDFFPLKSHPVLVRKGIIFEKSLGRIPMDGIFLDTIPNPLE